MLGDDTAADRRVLAALHHVDMHPVLSFKKLMHQSPLRMIGFLTLLSWAICAQAVKIAERPHQEDFEHYFSCLWFVLVTMTTGERAPSAVNIDTYFANPFFCCVPWDLGTQPPVGYGDMTAISITGRVVVMITTALGTCLVALLVEAVHRAMLLQSSELATSVLIFLPVNQF